MTFLKKFFLLHITVMIILVIGGVAAGYHYALKKITNYQQTVLTSIIVSHQHLYDMAKLTLVEWEKDIVSSRLSPHDACDSKILQLVNQSPLYTVSSVVNTNSQIVCADGETTQLIDVSDREYIQTAISQKRLAIGEYQIGKVSNQQSVNLAYPVIVNDEVQMVLILGLSLDWLNQYIDDSDFFQETEILITDRDATVLAGKLNSNYGIGTRVTDINIFSTILSRKKGNMVDKQADGTEIIFTFSPFSVTEQDSEPETFIFLGSQKNAILGEIWRIGFTFLSAVFLVMLIEFLVTVWLLNADQKFSR